MIDSRLKEKRNEAEEGDIVYGKSYQVLVIYWNNTFLPFKLSMFTFRQRGLEEQMAELSRTVQETRQQLVPTANNLTSAECGPSKASERQYFHQGRRLLHTNWGETTTKLNTSSGGPPLAKTKTTGDISKDTPPASFFKRLTRAEMAERRTKGLCFNCDEFYSTGHKYKWLFWIEVSDDARKVRKRWKWIRKFSSMLLVTLYPTFELEDKLSIEERSDDMDTFIGCHYNWMQITCLK
ncbi:hypothetical protein ZIOFF_013562 [Zingiber officinale]|uniref:Uncharacterized protein n=1 Tax=Zingiber officinale TaxID=94328 RepID=A0A8J5HA71_ZINOF|nr:hypothetical protein ZIOFF_013562 [Zingiber officinale]